MARELKGQPDGHGLRVGVIVSQFNEYVTAKLLQGARDALLGHGVREENLTVVWVPGSLELAQAAQCMLDSDPWDALVALGAVIRGETAHFDVVAAESARGIGAVARETGVPVTFGVLTTNTVDQAMDRAGGKQGNKGYDAAMAALQMANLYREITVPDEASSKRESSPRRSAPERRR